MSLTVAEKQHWRDRISQRIEKAILRIYANHPGLQEQVNSACKAKAIQRLEIGYEVREAERIDAEIEILKNEKERLSRTTLTKITGEPDTNLALYYVDAEINENIKKQSDDLADQVLMEIGSIDGERIVKLREEQANLLDTVWLATAPSQIRELVEAVGRLLGESPTDLTQAAMATRPDDIPPSEPLQPIVEEGKKRRKKS